MRETARDHTPMTALPYYHAAARAVPAITATPCGGYPPEKSQTDTLIFGICALCFVVRVPYLWRLCLIRLSVSSGLLLTFS